MARFAAGIEYLGTNYVGWQSQSGQRSIQQSIETALSQIANQPIEIVCAGRTDKGVHASGQVIHFEAPDDRPLYGWLRGVNTWLPDDITVQWVDHVPDDFHARYSAVQREYHYLLQVRPCPSAIHVQATPEYRPLDIDHMQLAANALLGEHDFSSFRASECQSQSANRCIDSIELRQKGDFVLVVVKANAFLHHMVRNIVGSLVLVGVKDRSVDWLAEVLAAKDRRQAGPTAKPDGLYLARVYYPEKFPLSKSPLSMIELLFDLHQP